MSKSTAVAMSLFVGLSVVGLSVLAGSSPADAQSLTVRCKVRPDFPATFCCKQCVAWAKGAPGTFVGRCTRWSYTQGRCTGATGVR